MEGLEIKNETQSNGSFNINSNNSNIDETKKEIEFEKAKKIILLIDEKKWQFIKIIQEYIDNNCVEFKKEEMRKKFTKEFENLAEKMAEKYPIEKKIIEGKIIFSNDFSNGTQNLDNYSKNVSQINSNKSNITNPSL